MKKTLLALLSVVCIGLSSHAQDIVYLRQDAQSQGLRYQVASVDEDVLVRQEYFREDWPERKWFRDDLRNCLREEEGHIYTFDPQGRMLTHTYTLRGKNVRKTTCTYKENRLATLVGEGCKVVPHGRDLDIYAESGTYANPQLQGHRPDYAFDMTCRLEWSDDGQLLASRYYFVDSMPAKSYEYQYNHRGQMTEMVHTVYEGHNQVASRTVTRYFYDSHDCLSKMTIRGGEVDDTYHYINNEQGDPISLSIATPYSQTVYTYEYRYDASGNWVMRLQWKDGVFENATLRTIRYHRGGDAESIARAEEQAAQAQAQAEAKAQAKAQAKAEKAEKPAKEPKQKAEKASKEPKQKAEKAPKEPKQKAGKAPKEPKQKAEKPAKEPKQKAEKPAKTPKQKAEKPAKSKKSKAEKPRKSDVPDELR